MVYKYNGIINHSLILTLVPFNRTIYAGLPTTVALSGTSDIITQLAPTFTLFPMIIFPKMQAPHPTYTLFTKVGIPP